MKRFLLNFPLGLFIGIELSVIFFWIANNEIGHQKPSLLVGPATSAIILIGAVVALVGLLHSLKQQEEVQKFERRRKLESARAFLPTALSDFCNIAERGARSMHNLNLSTNRREDYFEMTDQIADLSLNDEIISVFRDILEFVEDEVGSERLQLLLREYQIQRARARGLATDRIWGQDSYFRQLAIGWLYLHAISGTLFDFARRTSPSIKDDDFKIRTSILGLEIDSELYVREVDLYERTFLKRSVER